MKIGIVKTANIYFHENWQLSCELDLLVKGVHYQFKSDTRFWESQTPFNHENGYYFSRFLSRCMEICEVTDFHNLPYSKLLVTLKDNHAVAIASLDGRRSFNPGEEFEKGEANLLIF